MTDLPVLYCVGRQGFVSHVMSPTWHCLTYKSDILLSALLKRRCTSNHQADLSGRSWTLPFKTALCTSATSDTQFAVHAISCVAFDNHICWRSNATALQ